MTTREFQIWQNGKWETTHIQRNADIALHFLASELAAKYVGHASYITSIKRTNLYDGTQKYIVSYKPEENQPKGRAVYITDIY